MSGANEVIRHSSYGRSGRDNHFNLLEHTVLTNSILIAAAYSL